MPTSHKNTTPAECAGLSFGGMPRGLKVLTGSWTLRKPQNVRHAGYFWGGGGQGNGVLKECTPSGDFGRRLSILLCSPS
jgi:hypothetical protein